MDIDQLREQFPDETACRKFFESIIWQNGRFCPHCDCAKSYPLSGKSSRPGLYECDECKRQFTVTTRTPMHSTKLPLWKWLLCMYLMVNSSKGVSSVFMGKWVGVAQKTAWKMGHGIRKLMEPGAESQPPLHGIVELDEKYFGGKPRYVVILPTPNESGDKSWLEQAVVDTVRSSVELRPENAIPKADNLQPLANVLKSYAREQAAFLRGLED